MVQGGVGRLGGDAPSVGGELVSLSRSAHKTQKDTHMSDKYVVLNKSHTHGSGIVLKLDSVKEEYYYEHYFCRSLLDVRILAHKLNKLETDSS